MLSCSDILEDPISPDRPRWVEKSLPEAWTEQGIDAEGDGIRLTWHPNHDVDLAGYRIYRADTTIETGFHELVVIDLIQSFGADTSFLDELVMPYIRYYYTLRCYDNAGNLSPPADTLSYMVLDKPLLVSPVTATVTGPLTFQWLDRASHFTYSNEFVIRLQRQEDEGFIPVWICRFANIWFGYENETPINFSFLDPTQPGRPENIIYCDGDTARIRLGNYRWKIKSISSIDNQSGRDEASGESNWGFFEWNP